MSNISKTAKRDKLRAKLADLSSQLTVITTKDDSASTMSDYFDRRNRPHIYSDKRSHITNIKKRIDFINRKLSAIE